CIKIHAVFFGFGGSLGGDMVGNLRVPSITAVSFVVCRESFIGYSFARRRRGGGGVHTLCLLQRHFFRQPGK
ncbi:hypothetical protein, partial [Klebsiella pneumoniae]|uniref:hypothetical protein n=1 Tax=Klebsiella pneumoniae TaxID=573 RepID=UPI001B8D0431